MKRSTRNSQTMSLIPRKPSSPAVLSAEEKRIDEVVKNACDVTGARTTQVADRTLVQVAHALVWPRPKPDSDEQLVQASAAISEMAPQNATEAMLATQMIAVNDAALMFLSRATIEEQYPESIDSNVLRATRLMRVFREQLEALQRLRGKGQQKVTVEHVHVHEGGQAIVGNVPG